MSDFLKGLLAADAPVMRQVKLGAETGPVYFRKINAGERASILKGLKVQTRPGEKATVDVDLSENQQMKILLVSFSVCDEAGAKLFKGTADVQKLDAHKVDALYAHASAVNEDSGEDDAGKS